MSDGTGQVPMEKLVDGAGKTKRVGSPNQTSMSLFFHFFGYTQVKHLTAEDVDRIKAGI